MVESGCMVPVNFCEVLWYPPTFPIASVTSMPTAGVHSTTRTIFRSSALLVCFVQNASHHRAGGIRHVWPAVAAVVRSGAAVVRLSVAVAIWCYAAEPDMKPIAVSLTISRTSSLISHRGLSYIAIFVSGTRLRCPVVHLNDKLPTFLLVRF